MAKDSEISRKITPSVGEILQGALTLKKGKILWT